MIRAGCERRRSTGCATVQSGGKDMLAKIEAEEREKTGIKQPARRL